MNALLLILLFVAPLWVIIRFLLPRSVREQVCGELIHDGLQAIGHRIFGPRRVRIVEPKTEKAKTGPKRVPLVGRRAATPKSTRGRWRTK